MDGDLAGAVAHDQLHVELRHHHSIAQVELTQERRMDLPHCAQALAGSDHGCGATRVEGPPLRFAHAPPPNPRVLQESLHHSLRVEEIEVPSRLGPRLRGGARHGEGHGGALVSTLLSQAEHRPNLEQAHAPHVSVHVAPSLPQQ